MASETQFADYLRTLAEEPRLRALAAEVNRMCRVERQWSDLDLLDAWDCVKDGARPLVGWHREDPAGGWLCSEAAWDAVTQVLYERIVRAARRHAAALGEHVSEY